MIFVAVIFLFSLHIGEGSQQQQQHQKLLKSAMEGDLAAVEAELRAGTPVGAADTFGNSALHWASWNGHDAVVAKLLEKGASVDQLDSEKDRNTALMKASFNGYKPSHTTVVRSLLRAGAKVDLQNLHGMTALMNAAMRGYNKIAKVLITEGGADVKARDRGGVTSLHKAAFKGHVDVMETLIAAGADVNARRDDGITPMMLAESVKRTDAVQVLLKHGAKQEKRKMIKPQGMPGAAAAREL